LNELKDLKESDKEFTKKSLWKKRYECQLRELEQKEIPIGSEGRLLAHPDEVTVTLAGDHMTTLEVVSTLSKGACGDDPSMKEEIKEIGSEGHFLSHPDEVSVTLAGDQLTTLEAVFTLSKGVREDDLSISGSSSASSSSESSSESSSQSSSE
jgi:hypothetical protein